MKKKVILRCLIGAPIGLSISFMITLIISAFGGASAIWEVESWSLLKQTVIHCLVISVSMLPIAYCMYWMPHNFWGIAGYIAIFFFIYFFIWFSQYFAMKKRIRKFNDKVKADSVNS